MLLITSLYFFDWPTNTEAFGMNEAHERNKFIHRRASITSTQPNRSHHGKKNIIVEFMLESFNDSKLLKRLFFFLC